MNFPWAKLIHLLAFLLPALALLVTCIEEPEEGSFWITFLVSLAAFAAAAVVVEFVGLLFVVTMP
jgi:hypothetical protein